MSDDEELEFNFSDISRKIKGWFKSDKSGKPKRDNEEDEDIDFSDVVSFIKDNKSVIFYSLLIGVILLGAWVRTLSMSNYHGRLLGLDPYVFNRYANLLVERGSLPEVDTLRYFPLGFKTFREHQVHTYFIVGLYYVFSPLFGGSLMDYDIIYPVVSFVISMLLFFFMIKELFNKRTALIGTAFLSLAPSYLFRTIAGFSDKEAMATMIWFAMLFMLIKSLKAKKLNRVIIFGLLAGLFGGLSSLTWGGANFLFFSIGITFLLLVLMDKLSNKNLITYVSWYFPTLFMGGFLTLRYGGFPSLIKNDMFLIPTLTFSVIILKVLADNLWIKHVKNKNFPSSFYFLGLLIIISFIVIPLLSFTGVFSIVDKFNGIVKTIIAPFGTCPFCVSVTENQAPFFYDPVRGVDWWQRLQWFIPLFIIGAILLMYEMFSKFKKKSVSIISAFTIFMFFFMFSKFVNDPKFQSANIFFSNTYLYTLPLLGFVMAWFFISKPVSKAWSNVTPERLLIITWFALSIIATRGAIRVVFASTPIFILLAAYGVVKLSDLIKNKTNDNVYSSIPYLVSVLIIGWAFMTSNAGAVHYWPSFTDDWNKSMSWVQANTSLDSVFTHWWDYGYWVQTMGNRTTTVDGGNYYIKWDEVIGGQLFSGYNLTEVYDSLDYFKNNETGQRPNYLLIIDDDVLKYVQMANIGGRPGYYSAFSYAQRTDNKVFMPDNFSSILIFNSITGPGKIGSDVVFDNKLFPDDQSYIVNVLIPMSDDQVFGPPLAVLYNAFTGDSVVVKYNCVCHQNVGCVVDNSSSGIPSCIEFIQGGLINIPFNLKDRFMTQLYLLNKTVPGFDLVYNSPTPLNLQGIASQSDPTDIKIYYINYTEMQGWVDNGSPAW